MKNLIFNGYQERLGAPPLLMYTDKITGTSFLVCDGETVEEALQRKRIQFGMGYLTLWERFIVKISKFAQQLSENQNRDSCSE